MEKISEKFEDIISAGKPVLVDFYATWCGPCQAQAPILHQVKASVGDKAIVLKIDVDRNSGVAAKYGVRSVPTLMLFVDGAMVWREAGVHQREALLEVIGRHIR